MLEIRRRLDSMQLSELRALNLGRFYLGAQQWEVRAQPVGLQIIRSCIRVMQVDLVSGSTILVSLEGSWWPAPYWIFGLGPILVNDEYDYAIVSDPYLATLFVLTRNVQRYYSLHDWSVQEVLKTWGFRHMWNTPVKTMQDQCSYVN